MNKAYLVLEDGTVFEGSSFGADTDAIGETVFSVGGMCGYLESISDPSYFGQIVVQTFPLIGNYGTIYADLEGKCSLKGYVVRDYCPTPSNFRCEGTLGDYLKANGIPAIQGVDTRALTAHLRKSGCMNGKICKELPKNFDEIREYAVKDALASVSVKVPCTFPAHGERGFAVTIIDCGVKNSFINLLTTFGAEVTVLPYNVSAEEILSSEPDGVIISNGPGDPKEATETIKSARALMGKLPMLGIGLGHQIMALAAGCDTVKMKVGHRGGSRPVKDLKSGACYITNQNHGYEVDASTLKNSAITMVDINDGGIEALEYDANGAFSVQFYPELCAENLVFKRFINIIRGV